MSKLLLLWDIDGTLIDSGGAGERSLKSGLFKGFGIKDSFDWLDYSGRTDRWIARVILEHHGIEPTQEHQDIFLNGYLKALTEEMPNPKARLLPGIKAIVDAAANNGLFSQGLLTGNLNRGAQTKLGHFDLWRYFPCGAFADDSETRDELGPHALRRAGQQFGVSFPLSQVFVIGDTPHDIACGQIIGARTIAVATGRHSSEKLRSFKPSAVFEDFADAMGFFKALEDLTCLSS